MLLRTLSIPARFAQWLDWLGQFLKTKAIQITPALRVAVASDWSIRVGKDRQSLDFAATITGNYQLTDEQAKFLHCQQSVHLSDGARLQLLKPLLALFNASRVSEDGVLRLPEGVSITLDGYPDPLAQSVEITGPDTARVTLVAKPLGVPVTITVDLKADA